MTNLMLLFIIPFIASLVAFVLSFVSSRNLKILSFLMSLVPLALLISNHAHWIGSHIEYAWLPALSIEFNLRVDSLSLVFLYLTAIVIPFSILAVRTQNLTLPNIFFGLILFLEGLLIGFFAARDLAIFVLFLKLCLSLFTLSSTFGAARNVKPLHWNF